MYNFQVPDQDNLLDDITETSMDSNMDNSRSFFKNVFHNPLKDDSQLKEGRSFQNTNNENKMNNNAISAQGNQFFSGTGYNTKDVLFGNKGSSYEAKENKLLTDNFLSNLPTQNFDYTKNNYPPQYQTQSNQPPTGFSQSPYDFTSMESRFTGNFGKEIPTNTFPESRNQNMFLQDMSAVEASLNESNLKPVMNNPYGQNKSFNKSNIDISRTNLDNSAMKSNFVELGQKPREDKREYFNINVNQSFQNQNIFPQQLNLDGNTSGITEDTKDLSHLSINNFKQAFPQKENSYMLNTSKLNQSSNKKPEADNQKFYSQNLPQNFESQAYSAQNSQLGKLDLAPISNNVPQYRYTGDFGSNYKATYTTQPVDLLTMVNTNIDMRNPNIMNAPNQANMFSNPAFNTQEKMSSVNYPSVTNYFNSVQTIPKQSAATEGRATETKELQGLLAGLESLELSKISAISDSFLEDEEDTKQRKTKKQAPDTNRKNGISKESQEMFAAQSVNHTYNNQFTQSNLENQKVSTPREQQGFRSNDPYSIQNLIQYNQSSNTYMDSFSANKNQVNQNLYQEQQERTLKTQQFEDPYAQYRPSITNHDSVKPYQLQIEGINQFPSNLYTTQASTPPNRNISNEINYLSLPNPNSNQLQFGQNLQSSPRNNFTPRDTFTMRETLGQYPSGGQNYFQINQPESVQQSQFELNLKTQNQNQNQHLMRNSQQIMSREYHNPFSDNPIVLNKKPANEFRSTGEERIGNLSLEPPLQTNISNLKTQYGDEPGFPIKAALEADDIVAQMHGLYREWKTKNAELNYYMAELSRTSSQNPGERFSSLRAEQNMQNNSLNNFVEQKPRQSMQTFSNHANFYLNDKYTSPYEFRYSMQNPKSYNCVQPESSQGYQEFIKEDLLQGLEQPDPKRIGQVKQKFKTFKNPIFKKENGSDSMQETSDDNPLPKRDFQRDSLKLINKIFDTSKTQREKTILTSAKGDVNLIRSLSSSTQSTPKALQSNKNANEYNKTGPTQMYEVQRPQNNQRLMNQPEFKLKFKNKERARPQDVSMMFDEDLNLTIREEGKTSRVPTNRYHQGSEVLKRSLFGFQVKKDKFVEGIDKRRIDPNMDIICINCQEFININDVDAHSTTCDKSTRESHREFEFHGLESVKDLNAKILNIKNRLTAKLRTLKLTGALDFKIRDILRAMDIIVGENDRLDVLATAIKNLERLLEDVSRSRLQEQELYIMVYLNRILIIAKEKHAEIQFADLDDQEIIVLEDKIHRFETETKKQKAELEIWKYQAQMMNEIKLSDEKNLRYVKSQYRKDNEILSQIQSDIDYSERASSYGGTSVTSGVLPLKFDLGFDKSPSEIAKSETKKIRFYSMAVNNKLLLPSSHPGKDVLISDLYDECIAGNIPEEKWEYFIKMKLGFN